MKTLTEKQITALEALAAKYDPKNEIPEEDFIVWDWSGGNVDDAHEMGMRHGGNYIYKDIKTILETP